MASPSASNAADVVAGQAVLLGQVKKYIAVPDTQPCLGADPSTQLAVDGHGLNDAAR